MPKNFPSPSEPASDNDYEHGDDDNGDDYEDYSDHNGYNKNNHYQSAFSK